MNKETALSKINKYGKIGKIITIVLSVLIGILTVVTIVGGITLKTLPDNLINFNLDNTATVSIDSSAVGQELTEENKEMLMNAFNSDLPTGLNLGAVRFELDNARFEGNTLIATSEGNVSAISLNSLGNAVLAVAVALVLTVISFIFGSRLCKAFEICESPFEANVIKKMQHFAYALLPWALYSSIPDSIMDSVLNNSLQMNLNLDLNIIFTVLVILALTIVFKYGAELQRESDETL